MIVTETTHHGAFYRQREVTLPDPPTRGDVAAMLASCAYPYVHVTEERLDELTASLLLVGRADHGWTTWETKA